MIAVLTALLLALLPLMEGGASVDGLFVSHTLVFAIGLAALREAVRRGRLALSLGWEAAAAAALLGAGVLSFLRVDYLFGSMLGLWDGLMFALLFAALAARGGDGWSLPLLRAVAAGSSAVQAFVVLFLPAPRNMTPSGSFANASQLAAYLDIGILLAAGIAIDAARGTGRHRRAAMTAGIAVVLLDAAALLWLGARGATLALIAASAVWLFSSVPARKRRLRAALAGALALLAIGAALAFVWRFERLGDPYRYDRIRIWRADLSAAADNPILGMGPGMFAQRGYRYDFPLEREMFRHTKTLGSPHSSWLGALVETGAAGFAALAILAAILLRRLWPHRDDGAVAALWAVLLAGLVDDVMTVPAIAMTLIALLAPRLAAGAPREVPLRLAWRMTVRAAAAAGLVLVVAWGRGVLMPFVAHVAYTRGMHSTAIAWEPYNPLYRAARGIAAWDRSAPLTPEAFSAAHHDLSDAVDLDPGNASWHFMLAQLHARACFDLSAGEAQVDRAVARYERTIATGRKDPRPRAELAALLLAFGRSDEGIARLREAVAIEPRFLGARLSLARALEETGRAAEGAEARAAFESLRAELARYAPKNTYEADLMRLPGLDKSR